MLCVPCPSTSSPSGRLSPGVVEACSGHEVGASSQHQVRYSTILLPCLSFRTISSKKAPVSRTAILTFETSLSLRPARRSFRKGWTLLRSSLNHSSAARWLYELVRASKVSRERTHSLISTTASLPSSCMQTTSEGLLMALRVQISRRWMMLWARHTAAHGGRVPRFRLRFRLHQRRDC